MSIIALKRPISHSRRRFTLAFPKDMAEFQRTVGTVLLVSSIWYDILYVYKYIYITNTIPKYLSDMHILINSSNCLLFVYIILDASNIYGGETLHFISHFCIQIIEITLRDRHHKCTVLFLFCDKAYWLRYVLTRLTQTKLNTCVRTYCGHCTYSIGNVA